MSRPSDPPCSTDDIATCYDAIKAEDPASPVANLCLISDHADCAAYRTNCTN